MIIYDEEPKRLTIENAEFLARKGAEWKMRPSEKPLGPPKKLFDDTFSAVDALLEQFPPTGTNHPQ